MLTVQEKRLRAYLSFLLAVYGAGLVLCCVWYGGREMGDAGLTVVVMTGVCVALVVKLLMCWYAIADLRRWTLLVRLLVWSSFFSALLGAIVLVTTSIGGSVSLLGNTFRWEIIAVVLPSLSVLNVIALSLLLKSADRARYGLKYFTSLQFRTLAALAEVIIYGKHELLTSEEVAQNVDSYFKSFEAKSKWTMALVISGLYFYPILSLLPPLPYLSPERRHTFLKSRFYRDVEARRIPEFWRVIVQGMIRIAKQMCYIGYYNDKRTFASVGYVPFSERPDAANRLKQGAPKESRPLQVKSEKDVQGETIDGDVIIIGSGAAASILAKGLVEAAGRC